MLSKKEIYKDHLQKACDAIMPKLCGEKPFLTRVDLQSVWDNLRENIEKSELSENEALKNIQVLYGQIYDLAEILNKNSDILKNAGGKDFITKFCTFTCGTLVETNTMPYVKHHSSLTDTENAQIQGPSPTIELVIAHDLLSSVYDFIQHHIVGEHITEITFN